MTPPFRVEVTRQAASEIRTAAAWWRTHRTKAPAAFHDDLRRAFALLSAQPGVGARARDSSMRGVRRLHLIRIHYYLYYRPRPETKTVQILALWHTSRVGDPQLVMKSKGDPS